MTRTHRGRNRNRTRRKRRAARGKGRIGNPELERRLRAAGLRQTGESLPERSIDEFRDALSRTISMVINRWRGCREPACRRARGCVAPRIVCSNPAPDKPMSEWAQARAKARLMRAIKAETDRRGMEEEGK